MEAKDKMLGENNRRVLPEEQLGPLRMFLNRDCAIRLTFVAVLLTAV